jgi:hypothetical protein
MSLIQYRFEEAGGDPEKLRRLRDDIREWLSNQTSPRVRVVLVHDLETCERLLSAACRDDRKSVNG